MKKVKKVTKVKKVKKINKVKNKKINWKLITRIELIILAVLFVIGAYRIYDTVPAVKEAVTLATTVQPETFTELYFENHTSLPSMIALNHENKFKFTVHNLEYKTMTYPYEVYVKCSDIGCNGEKQIIDEGKITLKQNEYKTIPESFTLTLPAGKMEVVANLINKNQAIDFWAYGVTQAVLSASSTVTVQPQPTPIIVQPQSLTDFYFNYQQQLPITVATNQAVSFAFTVHDLENQAVTYPYDVYMEENGQTTQIDSGQFSLQQNEYKTIPESYTISVTPGALARINVRLNNENRYIYFEIK
jgi:hypothetical protein